MINPSNSLSYAKIDDKMMNVIPIDTFYNNRENYKNSPIAISIDINGNNYGLPYRQRGTTIDKPGVYDAGVVDIIVYPQTKEEIEKYSPDYTNFNNISDMKEYQEQYEKYKKAETSILTSGKDNVFKPPFLEDDTPEMRAIKEAISDKNIDLDKYASRFGDNYPNDKRKFKDNTITLYLIKRACNCLDMKARLILEDKNPDVANPIGRTIVADLTSGFSDEDE